MFDNPNKNAYCHSKNEEVNDCNDHCRNDLLRMINCPSFLSGMSHEMRTHMNSIVAFSFLMNNSNISDEEKKEFSNHILSSCEQLMFLFDNFFDSAIIDTGNSKAEPRECNPVSLIDELMSEIRTILKRNDYKDLVLILENQAHNNHEDILIDSYRVIRVLRNLFQNALSNTKTGYIKIGYRMDESDITYYVLDSGNGYQKSADLLQTEDLQESLQKYNDTSSAINLHVAKKLVNLMGGTIWVENNGISGTAFYFRIPAKRVYSTNVQLNQYTRTKIAI